MHANPEHHRPDHPGHAERRHLVGSQEAPRRGPQTRDGGATGGPGVLGLEAGVQPGAPEDLPAAQEGRRARLPAQRDAVPGGVRDPRTSAPRPWPTKLDDDSRGVRATRPGQFLQSYDQDLEAWIASLPGGRRRSAGPSSRLNVVGGQAAVRLPTHPDGPGGQRLGPWQRRSRVWAMASLPRWPRWPGNSRTASWARRSCTGGRWGPSGASGTSSIACPSWTPGSSRSSTPSTTGSGGCRKTGRSTGGSSTRGTGLALLLGDPDKLARHGAGQWAIQQGRMRRPRRKSDDEAYGRRRKPHRVRHRRAGGPVRSTVDDPSRCRARSSRTRPRVGNGR